MTSGAILSEAAVTAPKAAHNANIHGLRGLAASMVFLFHVYDMSVTSNVIAEAALPARMALQALSGGVELFFMISGYLITGSLLRHANIKNFLIDRAIRIYPVFLALHIPLFLAAPFLGYKWLTGIGFGEWLQAFVANALFLPGVFDLPLLQLNAWSLSYEAAFYLLSAFIYFMVAQQLPMRSTIAACLIGVALLLYPTAGYFLVGALTYKLLHAKTTPTFNLPRWLSVLAALTVLGLHGFVTSLDRGVRGPVLEFSLSHWHLLGVLPGLIFFTALARGGTLFDGLLRHRISQYLGDISYSFYLIHPIVMFPLRLVMIKILIGKLGLPVWLAMTCFGVFGLIGTLIAATISYHLLEKRLGRWLKQKLHRPLTSSVVA